MRGEVIVVVVVVVVVAEDDADGDVVSSIPSPS